MSISIESFRQLSAEDQQTVLATRRKRVQETLQQAAIEEGVTREAELVPNIPGLRYELALPVVQDRDQVVRNLMRADTSIKEIHTSDNVIYRR